MARLGALLDVLDRRAEQRDHVFVVQRVDTPAPLSLHPYERVISKDPQLMRDCGLLEVELRHDLRNPVSPIKEATQDLHAAGGREREHRIRNLLGDAPFVRPLGWLSGSHVPHGGAPGSRRSLDRSAKQRADPARPRACGLTRRER